MLHPLSHWEMRDQIHTTTLQQKQKPNISFPLGRRRFGLKLRDWMFIRSLWYQWTPSSVVDSTQKQSRLPSWCSSSWDVAGSPNRATSCKVFITHLCHLPYFRWRQMIGPCACLWWTGCNEADQKLMFWCCWRVYLEQQAYRIQRQARILLLPRPRPNVRVFEYNLKRGILRHLVQHQLSLDPGLLLM